jgi:hypothetical protein
MKFAHHGLNDGLGTFTGGLDRALSAQEVTGDLEQPAAYAMQETLLRRGCRSVGLKIFIERRSSGLFNLKIFI